MQRRVVAERDADEDAGAGTGEPRGRQARVFDRLPRRLEQPAVLRIHARGFARRDPEKRRIERVGILDESAPARDHPARRGGIRMMEPRRIPSALRDFRDRIRTGRQQLPERARTVGVAGETARHSDDGDRLVARPAVRGVSGGRRWRHWRSGEYMKRPSARRNEAPHARCEAHRRMVTEATCRTVIYG